jgi:sulfur-oxidizing protein SoxY
MTMMRHETAIDALRRHLLQASGAATTLGLLTALVPVRVLASEWKRNAFTATSLGNAVKAYGAAASAESRDIVMNAPEIAENGAQVVVEISSNLPGSQTIAVFVDKNPMPLAASFTFSGGAIPQVRVPLKMAESSRVQAIVRTADGKYWHAQREIKVTLGGCGG